MGQSLPPNWRVLRQTPSGSQRKLSRPTKNVFDLLSISRAQHDKRNHRRHETSTTTDSRMLENPRHLVSESLLRLLPAT